MLKEDKKRVLILGPTPPSIGGITTAVNMLMSSELAKKYDIKITANSNKRQMNKKGRVDIYNLASAFLILVHVIYDINIYRPKVVQVETSGGIGFLKQSLYIITAWIFGCKVITSLHCANEDEPLIEFTKNGKLSRWYCGWVLQRSDKIKLLSSKWSTSFAARWGLSNERVFGLKNCIDSSFPWGSSLSIAKQNEEISVVCVGSVGERKGSYLLVEAIRQLRAEGILISLILVGPEERAGDLAALKNVAVNGAIENYVHFMGGQSRESTIAILTSADIFALPSYAEGMPYSIIEALAVGCPVIASDVGAVRDVIVNEETGLLIEAGNIDHLVNALRKMVNDKMFRENLAMRGNMFARKEFGIHNLENVLGAIYDEL